MIKVSLREKKINNGKKSLYLDFYPPITIPETNKKTRREHLRLYIYEKPRTDIEREHNKATKYLGERIRADRQIKLQEESYGFVSVRDKQRCFLKYFEKMTIHKMKFSKSSFDNWNSVYKHLKIFTDGHCTFANLTHQFCEEFKEYLVYDSNLSQNTASNYFDKFKTCLRIVFEKRMISVNPAIGIKSIKLLETQREILTLKELQILSKTDFECDDLRRAAIFSALTGLRFSDISKLRWTEVQYSEENKHYLRFIEQKTKSAETLPINEEAFALLGERSDDSTIVFQNLNYNDCSKLPIWTKKAGINRHITFHSFRHTFATLQLTLGTEMATVSKLLGHKNLQTTKIYTKIIDEKKREAVNRIKLKDDSEDSDEK